MSGYSWTVAGGSGVATTSVGERNAQAARLWGRDLWFDVTIGKADTITTPAGDLALVEGRDALRQWIIRCIITAPGDWALDPDFGAGARLYVKAKNTPAMRDELSERIRAQLSRSPRIERVAQVIIANLEDGQGIQVHVQVIPKGAVRPEDQIVVTIQGRA